MRLKERAANVLNQIIEKQEQMELMLKDLININNNNAKISNVVKCEITTSLCGHVLYDCSLYKIYLKGKMSDGTVGRMNVRWEEFYKAIEYGKIHVTNIDEHIKSVSTYINKWHR